MADCQRAYLITLKTLQDEPCPTQRGDSSEDYVMEPLKLLIDE